MNDTARLFGRAADLFAARLLARPPWRTVARPDQLPPDGDWFVWLILAGRGWGKTRTAAEFVAEKARRFPGCRVALVASTFADGRDTQVEGESGLLAVLDPSELRGGTVEGGWNRSLGELFLANGSRFKIYSSERPRQLRGPQHHFAWGDEAAFWFDAHHGTQRDTTWSNLTIGTRLPAQPGWPSDYRAQIVVATTPRPVKLLMNREPDTTALGLMQQPTTHITRGRTTDNLSNLSDTYRETVVAPMEGTRLGRQELDGELLEDTEGALWTLDQIDATRVTTPPDLARIIVGVDPALTSGPNSDETGIIVAGIDKRWRHGGHGYVLADHSGRYTPAEWGRAVCLAAHEHHADAIAAEKNAGHDLVMKLVTDSWAELANNKNVTGPMPRIIPVNSRQGKRIRADPIAAQYEQNRWHHAGSFPRLEDQMVTWISGDRDSPDRLDALVHAARELTGTSSGTTMYAPPGVTPRTGNGGASSFLRQRIGR